MRTPRIFILTFLILCMVLFGTAAVSSACTAVYVGPDASSDGTTILARCNDIQGTNPSCVHVVPRVENKPGRTMPVDMDGTVQAELPKTTYRYTETPFMDSFYIPEDGQRDAAACINEYGVMMTMSVTAFANDAAMKADPWVEKGLIEDTSDDLVICQSKTAREAVEVLLSLIDTYGSAETNIAMIADQKEAWYVEMYTGHQYAAVKLPADKVAVFGNEFTLEYLSDYEDCIVSKDLQSLAEENGFAVYGSESEKADELNLFDTYSGDEMTKAYSHMRTWIGHQILAPSLYGGDYDAKERYPLCFTADKKVGMEDVAALMRNRFDGTKYDPDTTGRIDMRVIGTETSSSTHALQAYPDLPASMACVTWVSVGPLIYGAFVPVSNAVESISQEYSLNQPEADHGVFDSERYPYYAFKALTTLCAGPDNAATYGQPVRDYWSKAEKGMFDGMPQVLERAAGIDSKDAADYITKYCSIMQKQAFSDAKALLNDVMWNQSNNSNSMQLGRNPETHEVLDTKRVLEPMEVDLDPAAYSEVPNAPEKAADSGKTSRTFKDGMMVLIGIAILDAILAVVILIPNRRRKD